MSGGPIGRQGKNQTSIPIPLMFCYCFAEYGIERSMKPFYLISRRLVGRRPEFLDVKQSANLPHEVPINLLALIAQNRERCPESGKHLFDQHLGNGFRFFIAYWERFRPLGERVHACEYQMFPRSDFGCGPVRSIYQRSNGAPGMTGCSEPCLRSPPR